MEIKTKSEEETKKIGQDFAKNLKKGDIVALFGNLGAGKTIFSKGIAQGLGIKKRIISPTFTIVRNYKLKNGTDFYHLDLYRGEKEEDFESVGLSEIFSSNSIVIIEWADRIKRILPKKRIDINIKYLKENERLITIKRAS